MRIKSFLKLFFLMLMLQLIIGIAHFLFSQNNTELFGMQLDSFTGVLVNIISMPLGFLGRDLPFYHIETWIAISLTILNVLIQSLVIYRIYLSFKK